MNSATDIRFCSCCTEETIHRHSVCTVCGTLQPYLRPRLSDVDEKAMHRHRTSGGRSARMNPRRLVASSTRNR